MDSFPGTDDNVWGTAQGPTHSSLSRLFDLYSGVIFKLHTRWQQRRAFPDLHSGVIPKVHARRQQRRASPGDLHSGAPLKVHTRWQQRERPCLKGSAHFSSKRGSRPWFMNPVLGPPHASSLLLLPLPQEAGTITVSISQALNPKADANSSESGTEACMGEVGQKSMRRAALGASG